MEIGTKGMKHFANFCMLKKVVCGIRIANPGSVACREQDPLDELDET